MSAQRLRALAHALREVEQSRAVGPLRALNELERLALHAAAMQLETFAALLARLPEEMAKEIDKHGAEVVADHRRLTCPSCGVQNPGETHGFLPRGSAEVCLVLCKQCASVCEIDADGVPMMVRPSTLKQLTASEREELELARAIIREKNTPLPPTPIVRNRGGFARRGDK